MIYHITAKSGYSPTWTQIEHAVRRNFGGLPNTQDQVEVCRKQETLRMLANMAVSYLTGSMYVCSAGNKMRHYAEIR